MRHVTHAAIGLGVAAPFAAAELPHAALVAGALLSAGVLAGPAPDVDLRLGLRHRGITHSVWAAATVGLLLFVGGELVHLPVPPLFALVVVLAWLSHIAADLTNISRVAVLWPWLWWGHFRWGVREGSWSSLLEEAGVWVLVLGLVAVELGPPWHALYHLNGR